MPDLNRHERRAAERANRKAEEAARKAVMSHAAFQRLQGYITSAPGGVNVNFGAMMMDMAMVLKMVGMSKDQVLDVVGRTYDQLQLVQQGLPQ